MSSFYMLVMTDDPAKASKIADMFSYDTRDPEMLAHEVCICTRDAYNHISDRRCHAITGISSGTFYVQAIDRARQQAALSGRDEKVVVEHSISLLTHIGEQLDMWVKAAPHVYAKPECTGCGGTGLSYKKTNPFGQYATAKMVLDSSLTNTACCSSEFASKVAMVIVHSELGVDVHMARAAFSDMDHWRDEIHDLAKMAAKRNCGRNTRCFTYDCHS